MHDAINDAVRFVRRLKIQIAAATAVAFFSVLFLLMPDKNKGGSMEDLTDVAITLAEYAGGVLLLVILVMLGEWWYDAIFGESCDDDD